MKGLIAGACAALLLIFSNEAMYAAESAAQVFVTGVMPALFPMMVLCRMLPARGSWMQTALFSFASGSPASAQRVQALWKVGQLRSTGPMFALTGVMSPMFFVGTLARWTGDRRAAWTLLCLHWLSAILTSAIWKMFAKETDAAHAEPSPTEARPRLTVAIGQSATALLGVCGAMMLFSIAAGVLRAGLGLLFPAWTAQNGRLLSIVWALLEIGGGASAMTQAWSAPPFALLGALCSFGGLSIWMQNLLFASECIRPAKLLKMRALHGAICYGLGLITFS